MNEIKIDKGLPMPLESRGKRRYPFDEMEVGDSFGTDLTATSGISGSKILAEHRTGFKFKSVVVDGKVRVWRVA